MAFSFGKKYNVERLFDIDTTGFEYRSLRELFNDNGPEKVYPVNAIYINLKGIEPAPVVACDDYFVNFPSHLVEIAREILKDDEAIEAIKENRVGFTIYQYHTKKYNRDCYSIRWVDK